MNTDFSSNYFELFGLRPAYAIDAARLESAYRELQSQVHPDRFASATDAERRRSMQWATRANEAYQTLKKPLSRARYLVELNGVDAAEETDTAMPAGFLMQQIEWREDAQDARDSRDTGALDTLTGELVGEKTALLVQLESALDGQQDYRLAADIVRKLRFLEKLEEEIGDALEAIDS